MMEPADDATALPSPLVQTLARLRLANPYLRAHLGSPDETGGFPLGTIHDATPSFLDTHLGAMAAHYQTDEREVLARFYLSGLSFHLAHFAVGAFVAEACASALVEALPPGIAVETAQAELAALLGEQTSPLRATPEVIGVVGTLGMLGTDCCAMFRLPNQPYCATCPHLPHEARLAALQAWLAAKAQES